MAQDNSPRSRDPWLELADQLEALAARPLACRRRVLRELASRFREMAEQARRSA